MTWLRHVYGFSTMVALVAAMAGCGSRNVVTLDDAFQQPDSGMVLPADGLVPEDGAVAPAQCRPRCTSSEDVKISSTTDDLTLNELLGDTLKTINHTHASALDSYVIKTASGVSTARQYLHFAWSDSDGKVHKADAKALFGEDDDAQIADFLNFKDNGHAFKYTLKFEQVPGSGQAVAEPGLRSRMSSGGKLDDIAGISLDMLGEQFIVTDAGFYNNDVSLIVPFCWY